MELPLNNETRQRIAEYLAHPAQVVLITGVTGGGQTEAGEYVASALAGSAIDKIASSPSVIIIDKPEDKKDIPVDLIRELLARLKIKPVGPRVVLIKQAETMNQESQNTLLKTLEQPGPNDFFVLCASGPLLPTVTSRAQVISLKPISLAQALELYGGVSQAEVKSAWSLSEGAAGLLHTILTGSDDTAGQQIMLAKQFIAADKYQRAVMVGGISKDRQTALGFLEALTKVVKALHHAQIKKAGARRGVAFINSRKVIDRTSASIAANGSVKLALLDLVVNMTV